MPIYTSVDQNRIASASFIFSGASGDEIYSLNISGVTSVGAGNYTIVFETPLATKNYIANIVVDQSGLMPIIVNTSTGSFSIIMTNTGAGGVADAKTICGFVLGGF